MQYRDFEAWITSDGAQLPVYSITAVDRTVSCWISAAPSKPFTVHWKDLKGDAHIRGTVYVDGERACGNISLGFQGELVERSEFMASATVGRELRFAAVDAIDKEHGLHAGTDNRRSQQVILVKLSKVQVIGENGIRKYGGVEKLSTPPVVLEQDKELAPLCVSLGPERPATPRRVIQTCPLDPADTRPHVLFEFHYRSQVWLEAQGIIPSRTNDAPKTTRTAPCKTLKNEDVRNEIATLRHRLEVLERCLLKKEEDKDTAHTTPWAPVKRESVMPTLTSGNFIDLTDD